MYKCLTLLCILKCFVSRQTVEHIPISTHDIHHCASESCASHGLHGSIHVFLRMFRNACTVAASDAHHGSNNSSSKNNSSRAIVTPLSPPTSHQQLLLRQALLSGLLDCVAKRVPGGHLRLTADEQVLDKFNMCTSIHMYVYMYVHI